MVLGIPLFVATFIVLGRLIATQAIRTGIAVTAMGIVGVAPLAAVSGIRLFTWQRCEVGRVWGIHGAAKCSAEILNQRLT